jgi:hypothetical protein
MNREHRPCVCRSLRFAGRRSNHPITNNNKKLCRRRTATNNATKSIADTNDEGGEIPYPWLWAPPKLVHRANDRAQALLGDALRQLDQIILSAENKAPRFALTVKEGEATIVDDFRMFHAREAFRYKGGHSW